MESFLEALMISLIRLDLHKELPHLASGGQTGPCTYMWAKRPMFRLLSALDFTFILTLQNRIGPPGRITCSSWLRSTCKALLCIQTWRILRKF